MSEILETYMLFGPPTDVEEMVQLYQAFRRIVGLETDVEPAIVEQSLLADRDVSVVSHYGSIQPTLNLTRHPSGLPDVPCVSLQFESLTFDARLYGQSTVATHLADLYDLITTMYTTAVDAECEPLYVLGADPTQTDQIRTNHRFIETSTDGILSGTLETLYWLQIFPPAFADAIDREILTTAPAHRVETLADGAILLVAYENPLHRDESYLNGMDHFGLEFPT